MVVVWQPHARPGNRLFPRKRIQCSEQGREFICRCLHWPAVLRGLSPLTTSEELANEVLRIPEPPDVAGGIRRVLGGRQGEEGGVVREQLVHGARIVLDELEELHCPPEVLDLMRLLDAGELCTVSAGVWQERRANLTAESGFFT